MHLKHQGFTLIELSIVLVIISLLIAGILQGQSMIRQSQVNSVMTDAQNYIQAAQNFQQKYTVLPGDMQTATTYWGAMTTCPPAAGSAAAGGTLTCNGDGNGQIYNTVSGFAPVTATVNINEALLFWQHLANAGFIQGNYTGIGGSAGTIDNVPGSNCPASRVDGAGFGISYTGVQSGGTSSNYFAGTYGHALYFGGHTSNNLPKAVIMSPAEAYKLDSKYDDGNPSSGNILSWTSVFETSCATSSAPYAYQTSTSSTAKCSLIILTGF